MGSKKFCIKLQPIQHWDASAIGWLYRYADQAHNNSLAECFNKRLTHVMKKPVEISCTSKNIFIRKSESSDKEKNFNLNQKKQVPNKRMHLDRKTEIVLEVKRVIKKILASKAQSKRYGALVKLIPKWTPKLNARQQERICKAATAHQQVMSNILSFEAPRLTCAHSLISKLYSNTHRQVISSLKGLTEEIKNEKVLILVEKDCHANHMLFCKKKHHCDALTMAKHLTAVMMKQCSTSIIHIFNECH